MYFDENYHLAPHGENGVLFTTYYYYLKKKFSPKCCILSRQQCEKAIKATFRWDEQPLSHDNMTAIVCLSNVKNLNYHKNYRHKDWARRLHPRDIFFYLYMMGGVYRFVSLPFIWITVLSGFFACFHKKKSWDGLLDTDGKLLHWLRCEAAGWDQIGKLSEYILKKRHGIDFYDCFMIYFRKDQYPNHPIRRIINERNEVQYR